MAEKKADIVEQNVVKDEAPPIIAYLHSLSPIKTSQRNNMYFDMKLQTETETFRSVCFSAEKHSTFKKQFEASSPVKISNYNLKRNTRTSEPEVHINKRTKLEEPSADELTFDMRLQAIPEVLPVTDISEVLKNDHSQVSVVGKVVFHGPVETILTKGKLLKKQETSITDNSASIRLVLWENDITKITSDSSYKLYKVMVRTHNDNKYLTLNKQTTISQLNQIFDREHELNIDNQYKTVNCPADGVKTLHRFSSCSKCHTKVVPLQSSKIVKCSECGLAQLKTKCHKRFFATAEFMNSDVNVSLKLFEDKLEKLFELYTTQNNIDKELNEFSDDEIFEMILTVNATIVYNDKLNVLAVRAIAI